MTCDTDYSPLIKREAGGSVTGTVLGLHYLLSTVCPLSFVRNAIISYMDNRLLLLHT